MKNSWTIYKTILIFSLYLFFSRASSAQDPTASFTIDDNTVCEFSLVCFTGTSTGTAPLTYSWDFGGLGISTNQNPCWTFTNSGTYTVKLTVTNGNGSNFTTQTVTVYKSPQTDFSVDDNAGCKPHQVCFTDNTVPGGAPLQTFQWIFGDGGLSNSQNPCYTYKVPTVANAEYTVFFTVVDQNGCADKDTLIKGITVFDKPKANFNPIPAISCTIPATVQFNDLSLNADTPTPNPSITTWLWDFGDPPSGANNSSSAQSPSHIYDSTGTYSAKLVITDQNGCVDSITRTVIIDDFKVNITALDTVGCTPFGVVFTGTYSSYLGNNGKPTVWVWNFQGGAPGSQVTSTQANQTTTTSNIIFTTPGTHVVTVIATNQYNCQVNAAIQVIVHPLPVIGFYADTTVACQVNLPVFFTDTTPGAVSWKWDIDNWDPTANPPTYDWSNDYNTDTFTHTYTTEGCFNVSLIVTDTNGCIDTLIKDNYICIKEPKADFEIDTNRGCLPLMVGFTDKSFMDSTFMSGNEIITWDWDFGDGDTIVGGDSSMVPDTNHNCRTSCTYPSPTHTYKDTGLFKTMLIITTKLGCKDTVTSIGTDQCANDIQDTTFCKVGVGIPPQIHFYIEDTAGCFPHTALAHAMTSSYANGWNWDFGDGNETGKDPTHVYQSDPGSFDVQLIADMYTCADTAEKLNYVDVFSPKAGFNIVSDFFDEPTYQFCYPDSQITGGWKITIRDTSTHADFWLYDFGDTLFVPVGDTIIFGDTVTVFDTILYPIDTFLMIQYDTLWIPDTTFQLNASLFNYQAPPGPYDPYCDPYYSLYVADTMLIVPKDSIAPPINLLDTFYFGDKVLKDNDTLFRGCDTIIFPYDSVYGYFDTIFMKGDTMFWMGMGHLSLTSCDTDSATMASYPYDSAYRCVDTTYIYYLIDSSAYVDDSLNIQSVNIDSTFFKIWVPDVIDGDPTTIDSILYDTLYACGETYYKYYLIDSNYIKVDTSFMEPVVIDSIYTKKFIADFIDGDPNTVDTLLSNSIILKNLCLVFYNDTVKLPPTVTFIPNDTSFVDTFLVFYPQATTIITADTLNYGCEIELIYPADTIYPVLDTIIYTYWVDTICTPNDSIQVFTDTVITYCSIIYIFPDTLLDILADTFVVPDSALVTVFDSNNVSIFTKYVKYDQLYDTVIIYLPDSICKNYDSLLVTGGNIDAINFQYTDTYGVRVQITPAQTTTTTTPPDTICPDTIWHNCKYIMSDIIFPVTKTTVKPADPNFRPYPFTHTYTDPGKYKVSLITQNTANGCIDSTSQNVFICDIVPDFSIPASTNDSGCKPYNNTFSDQTNYIGCDMSQPHLKMWDFGDGCIVIYNAVDAIKPIDPLFVALCNNTISGINGSPNKTYFTEGEYSVKLTTYLGLCADSFTKNIVVFDNPQPKFTADVTTGCDSLEVHLNDTNYAGEPNEIVKWVWTYTNNTGGPAVTIHTGTLPLEGPCDTNLFVVRKLPQDSFTVKLEVTDKYGCKGSLTEQDYIVVTKPFASMILNTNLCDSMLLWAVSNSTVTAPATYYWDFCEEEDTFYTTTNDSIDYTYNINDTGIFILSPITTDTFNVTLVVSDVNGCLSDTTKQVVIHDPVPDFNIYQIVSTFCPPLIAYFKDSSKTTDPIVEWHWDYGDGVNNIVFNDSVSHAYLDQGVYGVEMTIITQSGCRDSIFFPDTITVSGPRLISWTYTDTIYCPPPDHFPWTLELTLVIANTQWIKIDWNDGGVDSMMLTDFDTTTLIIQHIFKGAGTYSPAIYIWDPMNPPPINLGACGKVFPTPIVVPGADIDFMMSDLICGPRLVNFTNTSTDYAIIDYWLWDFGDPWSGAFDSANTFDASHNYLNPGEYKITLSGYQINGTEICVFQADTLKVQVFNFPYPPSEGCPPLTVTFEADAISGQIPLSVSDMKWYWGDDLTSFGTGDSVVHTYQGNGDSINNTYYTVKAVFANNCSFEWDSLIKVFPVPVAGFELDAMIQGPTISTITFINTSGGDTINQIYYWDFADGAEATYVYPNRTITHAYADSGKYMVKLIVRDKKTGCLDTIIKPVIITIKVPNVFTPNFDGINDYFNLDIPDGLLHLKLIVFNRWGLKVWESDDYPSDCSDDGPNKDRCWKGTDMNGKPLNNDTYYYVLNLEDKAVFNGYVVILRQK